MPHRFFTGDGNFKEATERRDLKLKESEIPAVENIRIKNNQLEWGKPNKEVTFSICRRTYPEIIYRRIANGITDNQFTDNKTETGKTYGI